MQLFVSPSRLYVPVINAIITTNTTISAPLTSIATLFPVNATAGNITMTLGAASTFLAGQTINISKTDSTGNPIYITKNSGDTFSNGVSSLPINVQGDSWTLVAAPSLNMWVLQ